MIQTLETIIRKHKFFKGLTVKHLKFIAGCAKNERFVAGNTIFVEGDKANMFYLIQKGEVALELTMPNQPTSRVQTVNAGEILGWSWVSPPYQWHFNAKAIQDVKAIAIDARCLHAKMEKDHDLGYELLKRFSKLFVERLDATQVQLLNLTAGR